VVRRAFTIASDRGEACVPVDVLAALAEVEGPIGEALKGADGGPLFPEAVAKPGMRGGRNTYRTAQASLAAAEFASGRGEEPGPAHLLVAILDQGDPEVVRKLADSHLNAGDLRATALSVLGAPLDEPALPMHHITPAGTMDRPPLDISELDSGAWSVLCWRQDRLPLHRLKRRRHWYALSSLENRAALRVADRFRVDEDQRYSLLRHHSDRVDALAYAAHPDLVVTMQQLRDAHRSGSPNLRPIVRSRSAWERVVPGFMIGWPTWFANRRVGIRNKWFRLNTLLDYRGQPGPSALTRDD